MCVGVPMRIIGIEGTNAVAEIDGVRREASLMLMDEEVGGGDFIVVHAGFAISRLDEEDALQTLELMRELFRPEDML
ncbi:HypC/HybG/HupF family hydrogenase formation chaperone [Geobacter sp. DSM 9736]|uniref:HypC/HybG/HupF family hydrogenase formation chaperone n=1 Tax=Geobacter sp. DSM 9736 TaxID=1277350 RepID=UPI000B5053F1|nr:HypC/HybG/HupF family hydrogenase formation chaperone [Geobacter sp. DSM 9736]SNB45379.1 Hydrogenase maturation protein HypC [Geobacter sp. DSM 9736]